MTTLAGVCAVIRSDTVLVSFQLKVDKNTQATIGGLRDCLTALAGVCAVIRSDTVLVSFQLKVDKNTQAKT